MAGGDAVVAQRRDQLAEALLALGDVEAHLRGQLHLGHGAVLGERRRAVVGSAERDGLLEERAGLGELFLGLRLGAAPGEEAERDQAEAEGGAAEAGAAGGRGTSELRVRGPGVLRHDGAPGVGAATQAPSRARVT